MDQTAKTDERKSPQMAPADQHKDEAGGAVVHDPPPTVRFSSAVEEISPATTAGPPAPPETGISDVTAADIKALASTLQVTPLQGRRVTTFLFDPLPMSLPASRAPSHDDHSGVPSRQPSQSTLGGHSSPHLSPGPPPPEMQSPPLTPAGTDPSENVAGKAVRAELPERLRVDHDPRAITPQASSHEASPPRVGRPRNNRSAADGKGAESNAAADDDDGTLSAHRKGMFSLGPSGSSGPSSRDVSPSRNAASQYYTRPLTPAGDRNDPYAADKRPPQPSNPSPTSIESRFVFKRGKGSSSSGTTPRISLDRSEKRHSGILGSLVKPQHSHEQLHPDDGASSRPGSSVSLRRFFKVGASKAERPVSPAPVSPQRSVKTPPSSKSGHQVPFADDHGLSSKYGRLGKVLGAGAGGSVRLMRRAEDNTVFAVKEFRPQHSYETEKDYVKKLTAEFCIGSTLHHGNVIETLDIVHEKGKWFEVMEYAPYDLFAIVMTGRMSREEIRCCFLQILSGVTYLHSMGLAHRDLKLDNVVVGEHGIMKIIDFGSAHVFKYPFENNIHLATGIVGSDPYLAPEVYDQRRYDPQAVDIWSLAIIFCCMSLRRFPWKLPRLTDNSYKLFAAEATPGHDPERLILPSSRSTGDLADTPQRDMFPANKENENGKAGAGTSSPAAPEKKEVIRGPWRLLRLLPRHSRHIIGRMLQIDPKKRAKMPEILEEDWVANTVICRQAEGGRVELAEDHTHVLEGPTQTQK